MTESPVTTDDSQRTQSRPVGRKTWVRPAIIGSLVGAAGPIAIAARGIHQFNEYAASQPPGTPLC